MAERNQAEQNNGGYLDDYYDNIDNQMNLTLEYLYGSEDEGMDMSGDSGDDDEVEDNIPVVEFLERGVACVPQGYYGYMYNYEEFMQHIINIL